MRVAHPGNTTDLVILDSENTKDDAVVETLKFRMVRTTVEAVETAHTCFESGVIDASEANDHIRTGASVRSGPWMILSHRPIHTPYGDIDAISTMST